MKIRENIRGQHEIRENMRWALEREWRWGYDREQEERLWNGKINKHTREQYEREGEMRIWVKDWELHIWGEFDDHEKKDERENCTRIIMQSVINSFVLLKKTWMLAVDWIIVLGPHKKPCVHFWSWLSDHSLAPHFYGPSFLIWFSIYKEKRSEIFKWERIRETIGEY